MQKFDNIAKTQVYSLKFFWFWF